MEANGTEKTAEDAKNAEKYFLALSTISPVFSGVPIGPGDQHGLQRQTQPQRPRRKLRSQRFGLRGSTSETDELGHV
jgi:hypothetical protein